jgi:NAD(P)-dependent dehydrogenase (short-subunit alcohol dehydrogenase family)
MSQGDPLDSRGILKGKAALITGGASGIGRATARLFAGEGAAVAVMDVDRTGGEAIARTIAESGGRAIFVAGDVSRAADCERAVKQTVEALGGLHILFNNAGTIQRASVTEISEAEWDRVMAVNVKSVFLLSHYAIPIMAGGGGGVIINTASGWGLAGGYKAASYCASKGAVVQLTKAMALDHGGQNIRVNCICPIAFSKRPPGGRSSAWVTQKTSRKRRSIWPVMPLPSSRVRHWSWTAVDWQGRAHKESL